jgi:fructoselysine-6-P-deglycase FrlB-like protein
MTDTQEYDAHAGAHMEVELAAQPDAWERAIGLTAERAVLPASGERIAVVGCGTSWFMAQSYAVLRESTGHGVTDAYAASEAFVDRGYDAIVAITRSGTTTEVLELLSGVQGRTRTVGLVGDPNTPLVDLVDDLVPLTFADEKSVVQTRFATTALAFLRASLGEDLTGAIAAGREAVAAELAEELVAATQYSFLGSGWTVGIAHEAALKMREPLSRGPSRTPPRSTAMVRLRSPRPVESRGSSATRPTASWPTSRRPAHIMKTGPSTRWPT